MRIGRSRRDQDRGRRPRSRRPRARARARRPRRATTTTRRCRRSPRSSRRSSARRGRRGTVGVGMPGHALPRDRLVKNANSTWLNGRAFDRDLAKALGREVRCANDANCFALSEATDGRRQGRTRGLRRDRRHGHRRRDRRGRPRAHRPERDRRRVGPQPAAVAGGRGAAGPACYCGKSGCIETYLSGPGLARDYREATGSELDTVAIAERAATR